MKLNSTNVLSAGFALSVAILAGVAWLKSDNYKRAQEVADSVVHTQEVLSNLNRLLVRLIDIETGARGFVLTGETAFLEPFESSLKTISGQQRKLERLIGDTEQKANLAVLTPLITKRIALAQHNVDVRRNSGFEAAQQLVIKGEGKAVMDQIRAHLARMDDWERLLLDQRSAKARREARNANLISAAGTGLSAALFVAMFALMLRENRLRQRAHNELDRFFTLSLDLLGIAGTDGYFKRLSPAFHQLLGYTTEELRARPFLDFIHPDDRAATLAEVAKLSQGESTLRFDNRYSCKDGSWRWLSWKAQPIPGEGLIYAAARDVTALKAAAEALRASEEYNRAIVENSPDCLKLLSLDARLTQMGSHSCRVMEVDDFTQIKNVEWLPFWKGEAHAMAKHAVAAARAGGTGRFRGFCPTFKGTPKWWDVIVTPIYGTDGKVQKLLAVSRDITEQKEAEAAIQRLNAELQQHAAKTEAANKELEAFSHSVSHDLRAPLRHIHGYVEMLTAATAGQLADKPRRYLQTITAASVEMGQLIDDLLAFSRTGQVELRRECVRLNELVPEVIRGLEMATQGRAIEWRIAPLPAVNGDAALLRQVLANLVDNAVKYSRGREPARIEIGADGEENGRAIIFVRDNGAGFDPQYAHKLFGVFQRLHRAEEFEGTGIGLATVQRIVARHGGRVWAEGKLGEGAAFYFTLQPEVSPTNKNPDFSRG